MVRLSYIGGDPLVLIKLINPKTREEKEVYAYADTGSDSIAVSRNVWLDLNLGYRNRAVISTIGGTTTTWYAFLDVEFLGEIYRDIIAFYQDEGDIVLGRSVMDHYKFTFDGINGILQIEK